MATAAEENFFRSRYTTMVAFAVAVLLFLLPFNEFRCNGIPVAQNTGLGLATGSDYRLSDKDSKKEGPVKGSGKVYAFALAALILGIVGLAIASSNIKAGVANMVIGVVAALSLLALMFQVNRDFDEQAAQGRNDISESIKVSIVFTIWYYLSLICFLAAAFFSFKREQLLARNGVPANAPQLDLNNPGEQSEFPKAASDSEIG